MSSCTECHGAEGSHHVSSDCPRFKNKIMPSNDVHSEELRKISDARIDALVASDIPKEYRGKIAQFLGESLSDYKSYTANEAKQAVLDEYDYIRENADMENSLGYFLSDRIQSLNKEELLSNTPKQKGEE